MWKLHPSQLAQFQGAGGERFAHFIDRLIRAEAARGGLTQSEIATQIRTNIPDGGVDTEVRQPVPNDKTGWFTSPTCWQFKTEKADAINHKVYKKKRNDLQQEINKRYAVELIQKGYAYRLCILGDLTPSKVKRWETQLRAEVDKINPGAPDPKVIHAGHLLAWTEEFPAVIEWVRGSQTGGFHLATWARNCRSVTRIYVPNPEWEPIATLIRQHVDLLIPCVGNEPCLTIGGAAGVGK